MKITQHGQHLFQLTRLGAFSCYLVRQDDGFTLVDTNMPNSGKDILEAARTQDAPIARIVLTHSHQDHVGSLDELHRELPDIPVAIAAREARFLAGERTLDADEPQAKLRGSYHTCQTKPTRLLEPGDRIGSLEVVASPGHTPGHIAFFDTRDRTLLAGDAFQTQAGVAVAGMLRLLFPFPAMATWHKPTALQSARTLRALAPARLAVGHGHVIENPLDAINKAIQAAQKRFG